VAGAKVRIVGAGGLDVQDVGAGAALEGKFQAYFVGVKHKPSRRFWCYYLAFLV